MDINAEYFLHDALPIFGGKRDVAQGCRIHLYPSPHTDRRESSRKESPESPGAGDSLRELSLLSVCGLGSSEEHTSELKSLRHVLYKLLRYNITIQRDYL